MWGGADFSGGLASRRTNHLAVLALSRLSGLVLLAAMAAVTRESLPPLTSAEWAAAAGLAGALGIAALYKGLAIERAALVVPLAGVIGAAIPVLFEAATHGVLPLWQQAGLVTALVGIWLVSQGHGPFGRDSSKGLLLGGVAGVGFGGFFILLGQVGPGAVFTPLVIASCAGLVAAAVALLLSGTALPGPTGNPVALLAGVLDAAGVVMFLVAIRWVRLDIAAVLASLYPAITVLLFRVVKQEFVARRQWLGLAVCVVAIALITV
jgi:drug/metabolite transporter (DMT)-like permease